MCDDEEAGCAAPKLGAAAAGLVKNPGSPTKIIDSDWPTIPMNTMLTQYPPVTSASRCHLQCRIFQQRTTSHRKRRPRILAETFVSSRGVEVRVLHNPRPVIVKPPFGPLNQPQKINTCVVHQTLNVMAMCFDAGETDLELQGCG